MDKLTRNNSLTRTKLEITYMLLITFMHILRSFERNSDIIHPKNVSLVLMAIYALLIILIMSHCKTILMPALKQLYQRRKTQHKSWALNANVSLSNTNTPKEPTLCKSGQCHDVICKMHHYHDKYLFNGQKRK